MAEENIYEVKHILGKRNINGYVEYLIKWKGFTSKWNTWEPICNLSTCKSLICKFEKNRKKEENAEKNIVRKYAKQLVKKSLITQDRENNNKEDGEGPLRKCNTCPENASKKSSLKNNGIASKKKKNDMKQISKAKHFLTKNKNSLNWQNLSVILKHNLDRRLVKQVKARTVKPQKLPQKDKQTVQIKYAKIQSGKVIVSDVSARQKTNVENNILLSSATKKAVSGTKMTNTLKEKKRKFGQMKDFACSGDNDDDILYSVNDDADIDKNMKYGKKKNICKRSESEMPKRKLTEKLKKQIFNVDDKQGKIKLQKWLSHEDNNAVDKKPQKHLICEDETNADNAADHGSELVAPLSLYTSMKSCSSMQTHPSLGSSKMDAYFGDMTSFQIRSPEIPVSPTTSSTQKMLLDRFQHQLLLKPKNKKYVESETETVERRVSVRTTECAFRYKQIVVKKCQGYTQIWLKTLTSQKNAINPQVVQEIVSALNSAKYDDSKLVMFSSIGNVFCSGVDLNFLISSDSSISSRQMADAVRDLTKTFITFPKPVVAAVTGAAVGLGMALLPLCDIVYASDKALFFLPYTQLCQTPEGCISYTLPQAVGPAMSSDLLFAGRKITAQEAHELGLVSQVFWPTSLMQEVIPRVECIAMHSATAMEATKLLIRSHHRTKLELTNETECNMLMERWANGECRKAVNTYLSDDRNILL